MAALVTLGRDEDARLVLGDLESFGLLELPGDSDSRQPIYSQQWPLNSLSAPGPRR